MTRDGKIGSSETGGAWRWRRPWAGLVAGTLVSVILFLVALRGEGKREEAETRRQVGLFMGSLSEQQVGIEDVLRTLRALLHQNPDLSPAQFHDALEDLTVRERGLQAFVWAPKITREGRSAFEARIRAESGVERGIQEGDLSHPTRESPVPVPDRPEYLPIMYLEPFAPSRAVVGYDLLSIPMLRKTVEEARDRHEMMISPSLRIPLGDEVLRGVLAVLPVYQPELRPDGVQKRREQFRGCVMAIVIFKSLLGGVASRVPELTLEIVATEVTESGAEQVIYAGCTGAGAGRRTAPNLDEMRRGFHVVQALNIDAVQCRFYFRGYTGGVFWRQLYTPLVVLAGGLLLTLAIVRHLAEIGRQQATVEALVKTRTSQLASANQRLEQEVSERVHAEQALAYEGNLLRSLLDRLPDAVFLMDRTGSYIMLNGAHRKLLGLDRDDQALNKPVGSVGPPSLAKILDQECRKATAPESADLNREFQVPREDGDQRFLSLKLLPLRQADGAVDRVVVLLRDVTQARSVEAEKREFDRHLQETQKLESIGLLAGGVAHDFNNLLTSIMGNVGLARMDVPDNSPVLPCLDQIEKISTRAADLCRQMLAYAGKARFVGEPVDLSHLARETVELLRVSISKKVEVRLELADGLPLISGDETQLKQILMNLVLNASEAIEERSGVIWVRSSVKRADRSLLAEAVLGSDLPEGDYLCLEVSDTGCGMPSDMVKRIFDPFFTTKFFGRGLGLAAVLGIVRAHKAAIRVESTVGQGSKFQLLLPLPGRAEQRPPSLPAPRTAASPRGTLLLVDDETSLRLSVARLLGRAGFTMEVAADGQEGVEKFTQAPDRFQAVILDLTMPRLNGEETMAQMRQLRPEVRILLMSGFSMQEAREHFAESHRLGFLQKPFKAGELLEALNQLLASEIAEGSLGF